MPPTLPFAVAPPCLQRSQLDHIMMGTQPLPEEEEEQQGVADNVGTLEVGSAPAADDRFGGAALPSQPEVSRPPRAAAPTQVSQHVCQQGLQAGGGGASGQQALLVLPALVWVLVTALDQP